MFEVKPDDKAGIAKARKAVAASIDRGVPVLYGSEEDGLIVGYQAGGDEWICVHPMKAGGTKTFIEKKWPWGIAVYGERKAKMPSKRELAVAALQKAVQMANMKEGPEGKYNLGFYAWGFWLKTLGALSDDDREGLKKAMQGNSWIYTTLVEYRSEAAKYLCSVAGQFGKKAAAHLNKAADLYEKMADEVLTDKDHCALTVAPTAWHLGKGKKWTQAMRDDQIGRLKAALPLEKQAIAELAKALDAEGVTLATQPAERQPGEPVNELSSDGMLRKWNVMVFALSGEAIRNRPEEYFRAGFDKDYLAPLGGQAQAALPAGASVEYVDEAGSKAVAQAEPMAANSLGWLVSGWGEEKLGRRVVYAFCKVKADKAQKATWHFGSGDEANIWINGELVHETYVPRPYCQPGQDEFSAELKEGLNTVMVKASQRSMNWEFVLEVFPGEFKPEAAGVINAGVAAYGVEPRIVGMEAMQVLGVLRRVDLTKPDPGVRDVWDRDFAAVREQITPHSTDQRHYGVNVATTPDSMMDYLAGMAVKGMSKAPEGLVLHDLPAGQYAVFDFTFQQQVKGGPEYAHRIWLPASRYEPDPAAGIRDFTRFKGARAEFCIPVREKAPPETAKALAAEGVDTAELKLPAKPAPPAGGKAAHLAGLKQKHAWMTHMGALIGCAEYLKSDASAEWIYGGSGHAFALNIHWGICPSGPTAWPAEKCDKLAANVGLKVHRLVADKRDKGVEAKRASIWRKTRRAIDAGHPAFGWDLDVPEWYVITG